MTMTRRFPWMASAVILGALGAVVVGQGVAGVGRPEASGQLALVASRNAPDVARRQPQILASYGKLPMAFEANRGQSDRRVKFLSRGAGYTVFLTSSEAVLALQRPAPATGRPAPQGI